MASGRNIILTGMMGSGKSTIGRILGERLDWLYVDTDSLITLAEEKEITEIFAAKGEAYFRRLEKETLLAALKGDRQVIATGGGIVLDRDNRKAMRKNGRVIYLRTGIEELFKRLGQGEDRPLLSGFEIRERLTRLLAERERFYRQAKIIIDTDQLSPEEVVEEILHKIGALG